MRKDRHDEPNSPSSQFCELAYIQGNKGPPVCTYVICRGALTARNKEYLSVPAAPKLPDTWGLYVKPNIGQFNVYAN